MKSIVFLFIALVLLSAGGCAQLSTEAKNRMHCIEEMLDQGISGQSAVESCKYILERRK